MKIVFFGTPSFVDPVLEVLEKNFDVVLKIRKPQKFDLSFIDKIKTLEPDFFVVVAYGQILPQELLSVPKIAAVNIHPSLLPKFRGSTPIQSAILSGEQKTGVSFIKMDEQVDHGLIIHQFQSEILADDTFESLSRRLFRLASELLVGVIIDYSENSLTKQNEEEATFTKILTKESGFVDLKNPPESDRLERIIRAYYPWPGVWFKADLNGKETIIKLLPNERIQVEGKNSMSYSDFKNGYEKGEELLKRLNLSLG